MLTVEWRPIPGHPGYEASSDGQIRSVTRKVPQTRNGKTHFITKRGKVLTPRVQDNYLIAQVRHPVTRMPEPRPVSRLVLMAFSGEDRRGMDCRHINGDRRDNRPGNLEWGTRQQNLDDQLRHGTHPSQRKPSHCPSGHSYDEHGRMHKAGYRRCGECDRIAGRAYQARKRAERCGFREANA